MNKLKLTQHWNHPALNVRVFIVPLVKHCCANAVASDGFKSHWIPYFFSHENDNNNNKFPGFSYEDA